MELGDKMDLASYLLKPIQRMSKYALLLKDLIKECGQSHEQELADLKTAEEMVKFQLRHGNDLLAMDAIRGCDVGPVEMTQMRSPFLFFYHLKLLSCHSALWDVMKSTVL